MLTSRSAITFNLELDICLISMVCAEGAFGEVSIPYGTIYIDTFYLVPNAFSFPYDNLTLVSLVQRSLHMIEMRKLNYPTLILSGRVGYRTERN